MVLTRDRDIQKVTVALPSELKQKAVELKQSLNISLNTIINTALDEYIKKQELAKWENGAKLASKNKEYIKNSKELSDISDNLYEY